MKEVTSELCLRDTEVFLTSSMDWGCGKAMCSKEDQGVERAQWASVLEHEEQEGAMAQAEGPLTASSQISQWLSLKG